MADIGINFSSQAESDAGKSATLEVQLSSSYAQPLSFNLTVLFLELNST